MDMYVVGFALDMDGERVALIRKNRPIWQQGMLNGIGGHVELRDATWEDAMRREFREETGLDVSGWRRIVTMEFPGAMIAFFTKRIFDLDKVRTTTDEKVEVVTLDHGISAARAERAIPNLAWLLPLAAYSADTYNPIHVTATVAEAINEGARL